MDLRRVPDLICGIMNDKQGRDYEEFLETDFAFEVPGVARFRVNAFNQNRGSGAVFRTIPSKVLTMEDLGMGQVFREISMEPRGLVVVTVVDASVKTPRPYTTTPAPPPRDLTRTRTRAATHAAAP